MTGAAFLMACGLLILCIAFALRRIAIPLTRWLSGLELSRAIHAVRQGHADRIVKPGEWKVWRQGDDVQVEVLP